METKKVILIVEDEEKIRQGLSDFLTYHGFSVAEASDGIEAQERVRESAFDLILLDLMLPKVSGEELCRQWRQGGLVTPILMLTAKGQEKEKIAGLNLGADDYMTKPFSLEELLARIQAIWRRMDPARRVGQSFDFGGWRVDVDALKICSNNTEQAISRREAQLIQYFAAYPRRVLSRKELYETLWGEAMTDLGTRTVDMHIAKLRGKLEENSAEPRILKTVHGAGYLYEP